MKMCPKCNTQLNDDAKFCDSCGASTEKKPFPTKKVIFAAIGVVAVAALVFAASLLFGGKKSDYCLYLKDSEIYFADTNEKDGEMQITSHLMDAEDAEKGDLADANYQLGLFTYVSEDGRYIFYPDKIDYEDDGFNLYFKELDKPEATAVKIDSDIRNYAVNSSSTLVTYIKENKLFQYSIKNDTKDKIASEVRNYYVSDDGQKTVYISEEGGIYLKSADKDKEKIASDASSLSYVSEDFNTVYYVRDGDLYKQKGEEKIKIASDFYDIVKIYDSGEIYYLKSAEEEATLMSYISDDMEASDDSLEMPEYPDYPDSPKSPSWWEYDSEDEYEAAYEAYSEAYDKWDAECDRMDEEYEAACDDYYKKKNIDSLREELKAESLGEPTYTLCFYNGTDTVELTNDSVDRWSYTYSENAPVIIYESYGQNGIEKIKLSEIVNAVEAKKMISEALYNSREWCVAVKDKTTLIEQEKEAGHFYINPAGTLIYYIDGQADEGDFGELYRISVSDGVLGKKELYDSDVSSLYLGFIGDGEFAYFKDCKNSSGDLYINKNRVDYDVYTYYLNSENGKVVYFSDWDDEKECGTLKVYDGKKSEKISDDVHDAYFTSCKDIIYLYDYSMNYYSGDLYKWSDGKADKLDDDVICVLPFIPNKYRGFYYYN